MIDPVSEGRDTKAKKKKGMFKCIVFNRRIGRYLINLSSALLRSCVVRLGFVLVSMRMELASTRLYLFHSVTRCAPSPRVRKRLVCILMKLRLPHLTLCSIPPFHLVKQHALEECAAYVDFVPFGRFPTQNISHLGLHDGRNSEPRFPHRLEKRQIPRSPDEIASSLNLPHPSP